MTRVYSPRGDRVMLTVLGGYVLEVTNRDVTVRDKDGRKLATVASLSTARRFLKGYRREPSLVKAEPAAAKPAKATTAGSDKETLHAA